MIYIAFVVAAVVVYRVGYARGRVSGWREAAERSSERGDWEGGA